MKITLEIDIEYLVDRATKKDLYVAKYGSTSNNHRRSIAYGDTLDEALANALEQIAEQLRRTSKERAK